MVKQFHLTHRWDAYRYYHSKSGPGSNGNEGALHTPQNPRNKVSSSDGFVTYPGQLLIVEEFLLLSRHTDSAFLLPKPTELIEIGIGL